MSKRKLFSRDPVSASSLIRHVILGWLLSKMKIAQVLKLGED